MKFVAPYEERPEAIDIISKYFAGNESVFSNVITYENLKWEAKMIDLAESVLPERMLMSLHYDMIVSGGRDLVNKYHKNLISGKNILLEQAKTRLSGVDSKKINEAVSQISNIIKKRFAQPLNEQAAAFSDNLATASADPQKFFSDKLGAAIAKVNQQKQADAANATQTATTTQMPSQTGSTQGFDAALTGGEYEAKEDGGIWGFLKQLWDALTEGGSGWGILHLVLDIVGVLGDAVMGFTGIPVGLIADVLNAIIYFFRGKWLLGTISLIAGLVFGAGDVLKLFKGVAVPMEKVMLATVRGGTKEGVVALGKVPAKEQGMVVKGLRYIAKNIGGVVAKVSGMLGSFFDSFISKLVGWVPFIGKPLRGFFEKIGQTFTKYSDDMTKFANGFGKVEKEALEAVLKEADETVAETLAKNGEMLLDTKTGLVKCVDSSGNQIGKEFSSEVLTNPALVNKKYPNLFKASKDKGKEIAQYYTSVAKTNSKIGNSVGGYLVKRGWSATKGTGRLAAFIGKQIIKLITGKDWQDAGYTPKEVEYWGNSALQSWIQDEIIKKQKETGATYLPALDLDSRDQETFDRITKYQNHYAELFGQPHIIPVVYNKYGNKGVEEDFEGFWDAVKQGKVKNEDQLEPKEKGEKNESFKYIVPFSNFL
jgi:hypothetical protein